MADIKRRPSQLPVSVSPNDADFYILNQNGVTRRESRGALKTNVKDSIYSEAGQPGGLALLNEDGSLPANLVPSKVLNTVDELSGVNGTFGSSVVVRDPKRGGTFFYAADYDGESNETTVYDSSSENGKWLRLYSGPIDLKWSGAPCNDEDDDTPFIQNAIDKIGRAIYEFSPGNWMVDGLIVPNGVVLFSNQNAKSFYIADVPCRIRKTTDAATKVFEVVDNAHNIAFLSLYVEGDHLNRLNTVCGVHLKGGEMTMFNCNWNAFAGAAVISECGNSSIDYNGIFGWYGPAPTFTSTTDFRGALQLEAMGDSYVTRNEIGAGLPYFDEYEDTMDMLRDPVYRRIAPVACRGFVGTSVFADNLFENGDRAFILGNSLYNTFRNNRYELSGAGGLYIYGPTLYQTFVGERFANNSLGFDSDGTTGYYDIEINTGAGGRMSFIGCIFESLAHPLIPTSTNKVKYNILNKGSVELDFIGSQFDPVYSAGGSIDMTDPFSLPVRWVEGQYDPKNPRYDSVSVQKAVSDPNQVGYVKLMRGTGVGVGELMGALQFFKHDGTTLANIGFSPQEYLSFNLYHPGAIYAFGGGSMAIQKTGEANLSLWSLDGTGNASITLKGYADVRNTASLLIDNSTGDFKITSDEDISIGATEFLRVKNSGLAQITQAPLVGSVSGSSVLVRNETTKYIEKIDPNSLIPVEYNATTTALSDTDLNTAYPSAALKTRVVCQAITGGGIVYEKYAPTAWFKVAIVP